jgi:hypothetical protein
MYKKDHPYVKKRSVLVEALTLSNIDKIVGTYKGDKDSYNRPISEATTRRT